MFFPLLFDIAIIGKAITIGIAIQKRKHGLKTIQKWSKDIYSDNHGYHIRSIEKRPISFAPKVIKFFWSIITGTISYILFFFCFFFLNELLQRKGGIRQGLMFIKQVGSKTHSQNDLNDEEYGCFLSVKNKCVVWQRNLVLT